MEDVGGTLLAEAGSGEAAASFGGTDLGGSENTLLGGIAAEGEGQAEGAGQGAEDGREQGEETENETAVPETPDGYALTFDEGVVVDTELLGAFREEAHKLGLRNDQAQALAQFYAGRVPEMLQRQQMEQLMAARRDWEKEIRQSPNFSREMANAAAVLRQYGNTELTDLFNQTNLGSHPVFFRFLAKIGDALAEPGMAAGSTSQKELSAAEILYGNT